MLASTNEYFQEASDTIFRMSADDLVRKRCLDREEYYQDLRNYERKIEQDRLEHEQDLRSYERVIAENEAKYQQDRLCFEQTIKENEAKHQQDLKTIVEKDALISQLLAENEALRQQIK